MKVNAWKISIADSISRILLIFVPAMLMLASLVPFVEVKLSIGFFGWITLLMLAFLITFFRMYVPLVIYNWMAVRDEKKKGELCVMKMFIAFTVMDLVFLLVGPFLSVFKVVEVSSLALMGYVVAYLGGAMLVRYLFLYLLLGFLNKHKEIRKNNRMFAGAYAVSAAYSAVLVLMLSTIFGYLASLLFKGVDLTSMFPAEIMPKIPMGAGMSPLGILFGFLFGIPVTFVLSYMVHYIYARVFIKIYRYL